MGKSPYHAITEVSREIHALAREKGWYESGRSVSDHVALITTELGELFEDFRSNGDSISVHITLEGKPEGLAIELADVVIRAMDMAASMRIDLGEMIRLKHEYNRTRPYRHGGKLA